MTDDKQQIHVHPDLLKAVVKAVGDCLEGMSLVDLRACQEALHATRYALADMGQKFDVWRKLAEMRGDHNERLSAQVDDLQNRITALTVEMTAEIALLRSALVNMSKAQEVAARDDSSSS